MEDVKAIISKINQKFKNISNHPWFGLIEEKNNPYELRDLKKTIIKLNEDSKIVNEKVINFFKSIKLKLDLDENNLKKVIDKFSKAKESNSSQIKNIISNFDEVEKIEELKKFKLDLEKFNEFLGIKKQLSKEVDLEEKFNKSELKRHLFTIKNSIFLISFIFSSSYRYSKNYFKFISKDGSYSKDKAVDILEKLISFVNLETKIQEEKTRLDNNYKLLKSTIKEMFIGSSTNLKFINELLDLFVFDASENQILINKNFNELKTIKKQVINIEKVLQNFRSNFDKFSVKIDTYKFFNFAKKIFYFKI